MALWWEPGPAPCSSLNSDSPRAECITNARHQPPPNFTIMAAFWASKNNWKNCFQSQCYSFRQSFNEIESNDSDLKLFSYYRCVFCISSESETSKTDDRDVNFVVWEKIDELIDSGIFNEQDHIVFIQYLTDQFFFCCANRQPCAMASSVQC